MLPAKPVMKEIEAGHYAFALKLFQESHKAHQCCEVCPINEHAQPNMVCVCRLEAQLIYVSLLQNNSYGLKLSRKLKKWRENLPVFGSRENIESFSAFAGAISEEYIQ